MWSIVVQSLFDKERGGSVMVVPPLRAPACCLCKLPCGLVIALAVPDTGQKRSRILVHTPGLRAMSALLKKLRQAGLVQSRAVAENWILQFICEGELNNFDVAYLRMRSACLVVSLNYIRFFLFCALSVVVVICGR